MTRTFFIAAASLAAFAAAGAAIAFTSSSPEPLKEAPKAAPAFTLADQAGKKHNLSDFKGKYVVLEWWNYQCPFVVKHYKEGHMQKLQDKWTEKDVVWLKINSSAPGKQGHVSAERAAELKKQMEVKATAILLDHDGAVGRKFEAKVTPHMFVINPEGAIIYDGAIDSIRSSNPEDIAKAENYVDKALTEAKAGKAVTTPKTQPYGCSVKYPS